MVGLDQPRLARTGVKLRNVPRVTRMTRVMALRSRFLPKNFFMVYLSPACAPLVCASILSGFKLLRPFSSSSLLDIPNDSLSNRPPLLVVERAFAVAPLTPLSETKNGEENGEGTDSSCPTEGR